MSRHVDDPSRRTEHKSRFAKELRQRATDTERMLWAVLRRKNLDGARFRKQQPIGPYVVDFFCSAAKLVVELDGGQHGEIDNQEYDAARTAFLNGLGYRVLRITNYDFLKHREETIDLIWRTVGESKLPSP